MNWDQGLVRLYIVITVVFSLAAIFDAKDQGDHWYPQCSQEPLEALGTIPQNCFRGITEGGNLDVVNRISEVSFKERLVWYWHWFAGYFYFWIGFTIFCLVIRWALIGFISKGETDDQSLIPPQP